MKVILSALTILSWTTLFCESRIFVAENQTIADLDKKKGVRATVTPTKDNFEITIEIDLKNEFFDEAGKVDFVLTLTDEHDRCLANLPVDGFKKIHSEPRKKREFYSLSFTVGKNLIKKSSLIFFDTSKTLDGGDGMIYYVYFTDSPPKKKS